MMSEEELRAIDDWRFKNRIATRSEAVRRLAQIALRTSEHFGAIAMRADHALADLTSLNDEAADALDAASNRDDAAKSIGELFLKRSAGLFEAQILLRETVFDLARELLALHDDDAFGASIARADESRADAREQWAKTIEALNKLKVGE